MHPGKPSDAVQSSIVLNYIIEQLDDRTKKVRHDLIQLNKTRLQVVNKAESVRKQITSLDSRRSELLALSNKKQNEMTNAITLSKKRQNEINTLTRESKSLQDIIIKLEQESIAEEKRKKELAEKQKKTQSQKQFAGRNFPRKGGLTPPARGTISSRYHQIDDLGQRTTGIRIRTRHNAQIVAPYDGKVVFTGTYAKYGNMIIIKHSGGYYSILAGMKKPTAFNGQWLLAGEPIGTMGQLNPELYIEIRKKDRAVNPLNWISTKSIASQG